LVGKGGMGRILRVCRSSSFMEKEKKESKETVPREGKKKEYLIWPGGKKATGFSTPFLTKEGGYIPLLK